MLREEVKALCDVMGATLELKPELSRKHVSWSGAIKHPEVPFCYAVRFAKSNHQAATDVFELFAGEFEKDKRLYGKFWISPYLREMIDKLPPSKEPLTTLRKQRGRHGNN